MRRRTRSIFYHAAQDLDGRGNKFRTKDRIEDVLNSSIIWRQNSQRMAEVMIRVLREVIPYATAAG